MINNTATDSLLLANDSASKTLEHARWLACQSNRHAEAVGCYGELLTQQPGHVVAWLELGKLLKRTYQYDMALSCFQYVIGISGESAEAYLRCGEIYENRGMLGKAREAYRQVLERSADFGVAVQAATLLPVILRDADEIEEIRKVVLRELGRIDPAAYSAGDPLGQGRVFFYLTYHGYNDREFQEKLASLYLAAYPDLAWVAPHCTARSAPQEKGRLRIAFVSRFFSNHTIAKLNRGLIEHISRRDFEVHVFHLGTPDWMSDLIKGVSDHFTCCTGDLTAIRSAVAAWEPDIVYYTDIGMEPLTYFLAFSRLAPFQCVTWGHPVTSGIPTIDCFISHELCEMGSPREQYSERLFCLSGARALTCYPRPTLPVLNKTRADFGLPSGRHIYACLQSIYKIHPEFDAILAGILEGDPEGCIVLLKGNLPEHEVRLRARLLRLIPDQDRRVIFVPRMTEDEYLNLVSLSDVLLDTIHFGGGNSSAEAFAVGTPIVTLPSPYLRGRLTYAWYRCMGFMECVAESPAEYLSLAVRLGTDKVFHAHATDMIRRLSHKIFADLGVVRELETFLIKASRKQPWTRERTPCRPPSSSPFPGTLQ